MSETLIRYKVIKDFWWQGRSFKVDEELILPQEVLQNIGEEHLQVIKYITGAPRDKMIKSPVVAK